MRRGTLLSKSVPYPTRGLLAITYKDLQPAAAGARENRGVRERIEGQRTATAQSSIKDHLTPHALRLLLQLQHGSRTAGAPPYMSARPHVSLEPGAWSLAQATESSIMCTFNNTICQLAHVPPPPARRGARAQQTAVDLNRQLVVVVHEEGRVDLLVVPPERLLAGKAAVDLPV